MAWVVWRQYRWPAAITGALLAAFAAVLLVTGLRMAAQWRTVLAACTAAGNCSISSPNSAPQSVYLGSPAMQVLVGLTLGVPVVLGLLWGAPLVAQEIESGTRSFAWTQTVTRRRWLLVKAGWTLLAAAACAGVVAAAVTWWSGPKTALYANSFNPGIFDLLDIAPVGYALFATALGIAAGTLLRRTLPALGVTLGGFIAVRLLITVFVRQHYMAAVTVYGTPLAHFTPPGSVWVIARGVINKYGQVLGGSGPRVNGVAISALPASCRNLLYNGPRSIPASHLRPTFACMQAQGFRGFTTYQPANHFWAFQGIETGIFVALAAALLAVTFVVVSRRDA
jgi:hypothetical protein